MNMSPSADNARQDWSRRLFRFVLGCVAVAYSLACGAAEEVRAKALYEQHCAQCHGAERQGSPGVPDLRSRNASWGASAQSIAQTIRHGIRAKGDASTRTGVMPAFKTNAAELSDDEVRDLVEYLIQLREGAHDTAAALRGKDNFEWCVACHGSNARGNVGIGAPDLLSTRLQYGDTRQALFESIAFGRAGMCPPWVGKIDEAEIETLARHLARLMTSPDPQNNPEKR